MTSIRNLVTGAVGVLCNCPATGLRFIRERIFHCVHECFICVQQFQDDTFIRFCVLYGIRQILNFFVWLLRRHRLDILIKPCEQYSTQEIERKIINKHRSDMGCVCLQLVEEPWDQALDVGQQPVIVFCVISSRIGTDIESAMKGVHGNSPVILVLLHCVLRSLLRGDLSDDEDLLDDTLKERMTGIAHFAFSDREGLYKCDQNKVGFHKLLALGSWLPQWKSHVSCNKKL